MAVRVSLKQMKDILNESTDILTENVRPEDGLLRKLRTANAIKPDQIDEIKLERNNPAKMEKLLDILIASPVSSYEALMTWLEQNRKEDLYPQVKAIEAKHCGKTPPPLAPAQPAPAPLTKTSSVTASGQKLSQTDIRDITNKAKLGKANLDNLFQELVIDPADVENGRLNAGSSDFKLQSSTILHAWVQKKGRDATRNVIIKALRECDLGDAAVFLQEKWGITTQ